MIALIIFGTAAILIGLIFIMFLKADDQIAKDYHDAQVYRWVFEDRSIIEPVTPEEITSLKLKGVIGQEWF